MSFLIDNIEVKLWRRINIANYFLRNIEIEIEHNRLYRKKSNKIKIKTIE